MGLYVRRGNHQPKPPNMHPIMILGSIEFSPPGPSGLELFAIGYGVLLFLLHAFMALGVNGDARRLASGRGGLFLFGPFFWGAIVFLFGLAGLAAYWVIHHSSLRAGTTHETSPGNGE